MVFYLPIGAFIIALIASPIDSDVAYHYIFVYA